MTRRLVLSNSFILFCNFIFAQSVPYSHEKTDRIVWKIDSLCAVQHKSFILKKNTSSGKYITEKWSYLKDHNSLLYFKISYTIDSTDYEEEYYLDKGDLIYATEKEVTRMLSNNPVDSFGWAGNYYFAKNKLLDHITFGHGKSEIEPWDPERDTLLRYSKRRYRRHELAN